MTDLKFQVGLPTGMGGTFGLMGPINGLRYASAFNTRMAYEANEMLKIADPGDIIFQLEVPGELAMAYRMPKFLMNLSLRTVLGLVQQIEPKAPFGVHFSFGSMSAMFIRDPDCNVIKLDAYNDVEGKDSKECAPP